MVVVELPIIFNSNESQFYTQNISWVNGLKKTLRKCSNFSHQKTSFEIGISYITPHYIVKLIDQWHRPKCSRKLFQRISISVHSIVPISVCSIVLLSMHPNWFGRSFTFHLRNNNTVYVTHACCLSQKRESRGKVARLKNRVIQAVTHMFAFILWIMPNNREYAIFYGKYKTFKSKQFCNSISNTLWSQLKCSCVVIFDSKLKCLPQLNRDWIGKFALS